MLGVFIISLFIAPYGSEGFCVLIGLSVAMTIIGFVVHAVVYCEQINSIESIKECEAREKIYKKKAEALTGEFKVWLGEKYPDIEKEIFKELIPAKVSILAVSFPEIKSSETMMDLVSRINKLQGDVYSEKLNIERYRKQIRVAKRNPWVIRGTVPTE